MDSWRHSEAIAISVPLSGVHPDFLAQDFIVHAKLSWSSGYFWGLQFSLDRGKEYCSPLLEFYLYASDEQTCQVSNGQLREESLMDPFLLSSNTAHPRVVEKLRNWIDYCVRFHLACGAPSFPPSDSAFLPARLIDVGDDRRLLSLIETKDASMGTDTKYLTLSHRWGCVKMPKLTRSNYPEMRAGMDVTSTRKLFHDCTILARGLGIRYIWIDCVCICQDDEEDKIKEIAIMGEVYENAFCNIAALMTANPDESVPLEDNGLFMERDTLLISPPYLEIQRSHHRGNYHALTNIYKDEVAHTPLTRRGWVMQERILSSRTIYLGDKISWECSSREVDEIYWTLRRPARFVINSYPRNPPMRWHNFVNEMASTEILRRCIKEETYSQ